MRCRDNLYQVRTIVDHQLRWSAIFTPAHKHKSSARNIIPKYSKDSNIVNQEGGKTLAEFPNSIELGKLGLGQDPNNKEHSTTKERKSCLVIPRLQHVRSLTPRAAATVSRTDRRLTCTVLFAEASIEQVQGESKVQVNMHAKARKLAPLSSNFFILISQTDVINPSSLTASSSNSYMQEDIHCFSLRTAPLPRSRSAGDRLARTASFLREEVKGLSDSQKSSFVSRQEK
ncbi:hypothetical protein AgCh_009440 [Apium graveolens]